MCSRIAVALVLLVFTPAAAPLRAWAYMCDSSGDADPPGSPGMYARR